MAEREGDAKGHLCKPLKDQQLCRKPHRDSHLPSFAELRLLAAASGICVVSRGLGTRLGTRGAILLRPQRDHRINLSCPAGMYAVGAELRLAGGGAALPSAALDVCSREFRSPSQWPSRLMRLIVGREKLSSLL